MKYNIDFAKAAAERAIKTVAQTAVAVIGLYISGIAGERSLASTTSIGSAGPPLLRSQASFRC